MGDEPVTIVDRDVLKVLSTDTRMDILKVLAEGKRNPSFVAKKLGKSDATIVEHLKIMEKVGLVKKTTAPGKKWVFYSLTERGQGIVSSKSRRLVIILSSSLVGLAVGAGLFASHLYTSRILGGKFMTQPAAEAADRVLVPGEAGVGAVLAAQPPVVLYASITLLAISIVGLGFYFYKKSKLDKGVRL